MALLPSRYDVGKDSVPKVQKKITEQECRGVIQEIRNLVSKDQKRMQSAAEEGPYWARMVKEDIIDETTKFIDGYEISSSWNSEDARILQKIRSLLLTHKQALPEIKNEIATRMTIENTYYMLERILGIDGRERPTVGIFDPEKGKIELYPEDI